MRIAPLMSFPSLLMLALLCCAPCRAAEPKTPDTKEADSPAKDVPAKEAAAKDDAPGKDEDAPSATVATPQPPLTEEEITGFITQLGSDTYAERETATQKLSKGGAAAVPALTKAALNAEVLEVAARAVRALQLMYQNGDSEAYDAAEVALEEIAESRTNRGLARRASLALSTQTARRQVRAIARFKEYGGKVREATPNGITITGENGAPLVSELIIGSGWKGGKAGLAQVKRMTGVTALYVINQAISADEVAELLVALPQLRVQHRGQAMLGVSAIATERGCEIFTIKEGSAAERADLMTGDIITRFDGKPVKTFDELTDLIKTKKGGDKVVVELIRDGEMQSKDVVLGEWE